MAKKDKTSPPPDLCMWVVVQAQDAENAEAALIELGFPLGFARSATTAAGALV